MYIQSGLILSEHFPLRLGCSPLIFHHWKPSLVWISGRTMGFTSRVSRVWGIGIVNRLCRLKLDLEAVVEDANEEVYSFQIQRSLIYLKFVGGCRISHTISSSYPTISTLTFYHNPSRGGIILRNLIILNHEAFIAIFNSGYIL